MTAYITGNRVVPVFRADKMLEMDTGLRFIALVDIALRGHTAFRQGKMLELHRCTSVVGKITGIVGTTVLFGETRGKSQRKDAEKRETDQQLFQITFPPPFAES